MKITRMLGTLFFLCGMMAVSCSSRSGQPLVGTWQEVNGTESIIFLNDGSFSGKLIWDMNKQPVEVAGTYTIKGELLQLKVDKPANLAPMTWKLSISGAEMTAIFQQGGSLKFDGSSLKYRRIP